jgi:uncharacterized membrane protein YccC
MLMVNEMHKLDKAAMKEAVVDTLTGTLINLPLVWLVLFLLLMVTHNSFLISLAQASVLTVVAIVRKYYIRVWFKKNGKD